MGPVRPTRFVPLLIVLTITATCPLGVTAGSSDESELKAAFLIGFARFIEHTDAADVVLCTAGDAHITDVLTKLGAGKKINGRTLVVRSVEHLENVAGCSILFIGARKLGLLREIASDAGEMKVLTVGDSPGFLDTGGALEFIWTGNKIQFNASLAAIQRSGVKVNSRLLTLARNLKNGGAD